MEEVRRKKRIENKGIYSRGELLGRFTARKLFGWSDKRYDEEYWAKLERNWRKWKGGQVRGKRTLEIIKEEEEEEIKQEGLGLREQEEEDDEMGNISDLYYEL